MLNDSYAFYGNISIELVLLLFRGSKEGLSPLTSLLWSQSAQRKKKLHKYDTICMTLWLKTIRLNLMF